MRKEIKKFGVNYTSHDGENVSEFFDTHNEAYEYAVSIKAKDIEIVDVASLTKKFVKHLIDDDAFEVFVAFVITSDSNTNESQICSNLMVLDKMIMFCSDAISSSNVEFIKKSISILENDLKLLTED